jgi:hypothetical protein
MPRREGFSFSLLVFVIGVGMMILAGCSFVPEQPWRFRLLSWGLACWAISTALPF